MTVKLLLDVGLYSGDKIFSTLTAAQMDPCNASALLSASVEVNIASHLK
jgi:hypothetical protein